MLDFIVLGLIPGTNIQIGFGGMLVLELLAFFALNHFWKNSPLHANLKIHLGRKNHNSSNTSS